MNYYNNSIAAFSLFILSACGISAEKSNDSMSCSRQIMSMKKNLVCMDVYSTAEVFEDSGSENSCVDSTPERLAASATQSLPAAAQYIGWDGNCSKEFVGPAQVVTAADVVYIVENECDNRAKVRKFLECRSNFRGIR